MGRPGHIIQATVLLTTVSPIRDDEVFLDAEVIVLAPKAWIERTQHTDG